MAIHLANEPLVAVHLEPGQQVVAVSQPAMEVFQGLDSAHSAEQRQQLSLPYSAPEPYLPLRVYHGAGLVVLQEPELAVATLLPVAEQPFGQVGIGPLQEPVPEQALAGPVFVLELELQPAVADNLRSR